MLSKKNGLLVLHRCVETEDDEWYDNNEVKCIYDAHKE